jgi:hypothetical protein
MHTLRDLHGSIPGFIHITDGKTHEINVLDGFIADKHQFLARWPAPAPPLAKARPAPWQRWQGCAGCRPGVQRRRKRARNHASLRLSGPALLSGSML